MITFIKHNILVVALAGIVIALGIWYTFSGGGSTETIITTETAGSTAESEVVDTLLTLRAVTLSGTIFNDPAFKTLKDFGTQIVPEAVGKPNPFAPRPGDSANKPK